MSFPLASIGFTFLIKHQGPDTDVRIVFKGFWLVKDISQKVQHFPFSEDHVNFFL